MKVFKMEILVKDEGDYGIENAKLHIEQHKYLDAFVMNVEERDIGEWEDNNLLNFYDKRVGEAERLFSTKPFEVGSVVQWMGEECIIIGIDKDTGDCNISNAARHINLTVGRHVLAIHQGLTNGN